PKSRSPFPCPPSRDAPPPACGPWRRRRENALRRLQCARVSHGWPWPATPAMRCLNPRHACERCNTCDAEAPPVLHPPKGRTPSGGRGQVRDAPSPIGGSAAREYVLLREIDRIELIVRGVRAQAPTERERRVIVLVAHVDRHLVGRLGP